MGPASRIRATPGLPWATCSSRVEDVDPTRERLTGLGLVVSAVDGVRAVCRFFISK